MGSGLKTVRMIREPLMLLLTRFLLVRIAAVVLALCLVACERVRIDEDGLAVATRVCEQGDVRGWLDVRSAYKSERPLW